MKIEKKTIYNITLDSDEKNELSRYLSAAKSATQGSICESVTCNGVACADCPFNEITELEEAMYTATTKFLEAYRALQKDNPSLPLID